MDNIKFLATNIQPNPVEVNYWVDLSDNPYGGSIKYYNGEQWVRLAESGGIPDLSNYYTKKQVNNMLNDKADTSTVDSKVDDEEVKDVIKNISFRTALPDQTQMILLKYDGTTMAVTLPIASNSQSGIITASDFLDFVKQIDLVKLYQEMYDIAEDIRFKYQKKLTPGLNINISDDNVISATGDIAVKWDNILNKPDFKPVSTSGDYNDLINKLKPGKDVHISNSNVITIDIDSDKLAEDLSKLDTKINQETSRATAKETELQSNIKAEETRAINAEQQNATAIANEISDRIADVTDEQNARIIAVDTEKTRAMAAEKKLTDDLASEAQTRSANDATEKNRAESAEATITTNLNNEVVRAKAAELANKTAIEKEVVDRKEAIDSEVIDRNAAILVETQRAQAEEAELLSKIDDHTTTVNAALALKADKADTYTKAQVDSKLSGAYKVKGSSTFENLPISGNVIGDVYNITNAFDLDGNHYDAGTNVVWTDQGWDPLSGSFDTTKIEGDIQNVADNLSVEIVRATTAEQNITNSVTTLAGRVTTAEGKLETIQGNDTVIGSISNSLKESKQYTDSKITIEQTRAEEAESTIQSNLNTEISRAQGAESANTTAIQNEVARATSIESALRSDIDIINGDELTTGSINKALNDSKTYTDNIAATKVDKVSGKGLSTNDYTTDEKNKLSGIEAQANKYILPVATISSLGGVKLGNNITNESGLISITKDNVVNALGVDPTTKYVTIDTDQTLTGRKTFYAGQLVLQGQEISPISTRQWSNGTFVMSNVNISPTFASLKNSLTFNWHNSGVWAIGNVRGSNTASDGFGIGYYEENDATSITGKLLLNKYGSLNIGGDYLVNSGNTIFVYSCPKKVLTSEGTIHGGTDGATSTDANLRFGSWHGIGWYTTCSGQAVPQGENAMWLNVRNGELRIRSKIWVSADKSRKGVFDSTADDTSMSRLNESSVQVNYITLKDNITETQRPYKTTVADGTAPFITNSKTLCTNLNADMVDGYQAVNIPHMYDSITDVKYPESSYAGLYKLCTINISTYYSSYTFHVQNEFWGDQHNCSFDLFIATVNNNTGKGTTIIKYNDVGNTKRSIYYDANYTTNKLVIYVHITRGNNGGTWLLNQTSGNQLIQLSLENVDINLIDNCVLVSDYSHQIVAETPDWYGVSWSETDSNPTCTRIGNMDMHRTLPIQSAMRGCIITNIRSGWGEQIRYLENDWSKTIGGWVDFDTDLAFTSNDKNFMIEIPEFWWTDDYNSSTKTHNLKLSDHPKAGWNHHKLAYVGAYEGYVDGGYYQSMKGKLPTTTVTRTSIRTAARANDNPDEYKWNIYTYAEHRAICHLFLVEYATRHSQLAVNTSLTIQGFRQGGLGTGCTTGVVNGQYSFIPTGTSDSLGNGSGEVTWTDGTNSRKCNRYRGIENPFGHVWKHCDDVISQYVNSTRRWYICKKPSQFSTNKNYYYKVFCSAIPTEGYKKTTCVTPTCDFFARESSGASETTYWCDYNWDNTDATEHCLLIGGYSGNGGNAGLFYLASYGGVGASYSHVGSRLTYLPWAE